MGIIQFSSTNAVRSKPRHGDVCAAGDSLHFIVRQGSSLVQLCKGTSPVAYSILVFSVHFFLFCFAFGWRCCGGGAVVNEGRGTEAKTFSPVSEERFLPLSLSSPTPRHGLHQRTSETEERSFSSVARLMFAA